MAFAWINEDGHCSYSLFRENVPSGVDFFEVPEGFKTCPETLYRREGNGVVPDAKLNQARRLACENEYTQTSSAEWRNADALPDPVETPAAEFRLHHPSHFAADAAKSLRKLGCEVDPELLGGVVDTLFYASLEREEGKFYPISIELPHAPGVRRLDDDAFAFEEPIPLTPQSLIKLAPSLDPAQSNLFVDPGPPAEIWGMNARDRFLHRWMTNASHTGWSTWGPRGPVFRCRGPGHLVAELESTRICELKRGVLFTDYIQVFSEDGPLKRFLDSHKVITSTERMSIRDAVHRLIARLASSGDGALVAVVGVDDFESLTPGELVAPGISVGWPRMEEFLNHRRPLETYLGGRPELDQRLLELLGQVFQGAGSVLAAAAMSLAMNKSMILDASFRGDLLSHDDHMRRTKAIETDYSDAINAVRHLARPDGALLLSTRLHVLSFASKVLKVEDVDVFRAQDAATTKIEQFSLKSVGTRHRSGVWLASRLPHSCVFVVSEDGIVSAIKRWRGRTIIWRPVTTDRCETVDRSQPRWVP